jgi:hypothetical protein
VSLFVVALEKETNANVPNVKFRDPSFTTTTTTPLQLACAYMTAFSLTQKLTTQRSLLK